MKDFVSRHLSALLIAAAILFIGSCFFIFKSDKESEIHKIYIEQQAMQDKALATVHEQYADQVVSKEVMTLIENDAISKLREKPDYKRLDFKILSLSSDSKSLSTTILILMAILGMIVSAAAAGFIQHMFTQVKWTRLLDTGFTETGEKVSATEKGEIIRFFGKLIMTCGIIYAAVVGIGVAFIN